MLRFIFPFPPPSFTLTSSSSFSSSPTPSLFFFRLFLLLPFSSFSSSPPPASSPFPPSPLPLLLPLLLPFSGAHPTSRLDVEDSRLPLDISIHAYPRYRFNDMNTSATPAIAFTAVVHNPLSTSANASFLFNLPLGIEPDTQRVKPKMTPPQTESTPGNILGQHQVSSEMDCFDNCSKSDSCMSWSYDGTNQSCSLYDDVRMNGHMSGSYSGVKVLIVMPTLYMYMYIITIIIV